MQEFAPGYQPVRADNLTQNYFPLVTPVPSPQTYEDGFRRTARINTRNQYEQQLRTELSSFFGLSEFALLAVAVFASNRDERHKARRTLHVRNAALMANGSGGLPYALPGPIP